MVGRLNFDILDNVTMQKYGVEFDLEKLAHIILKSKEIRAFSDHS